MSQDTIYKFLAFFITLAVVIGLAYFVWSAPNFSRVRSLEPETDLTYHLGTTTLRWLNFYSRGASTTAISIGTSTPSGDFPLTVSGGGLFTGTSTFGGVVATTTFQVKRLVSCNTVDTNAQGEFICGTDEGGAGTPGGSDSQVQYNNSGSFGGATGFVFDDTNLRVGIGTTSPGLPFSVHSEALVGATLTASRFQGTSTVASFLNFASSTSLSLSNLLNVSGGGTSTFAGGLTVAGETQFSSRITLPLGNLLFPSINFTGAGDDVGIYSDGTSILITGGGANIAEFNQGGTLSLGINRQSSDTTLGVGGSGTFSNDLFIIGGDINIGTGLATTTLTSANTRFGIASTSPGALLSVMGEGLFANAVTASRFQGTSTIASFFNFASSTSLSLSNLLNVNGAGTSTFTGGLTVGSIQSANGVEITAGCFSINGVCQAFGGGGTPGGSDTQVQYNNGGAFGGATGFVFDDVNLRVGVGTTTPGVIFSNAGEAIIGGILTTSGVFSTSTYGFRGSTADAAGTPAFSWNNDSDTGVFNIAADELGLTTAGVQRLSIDATDMVFTVPVRAPNGSASAPAYSFTNDNDTGIWNNSGDNILRFAGGGNNTIAITTTGLQSSFTSSFLLTLNGTAVNPEYSFREDTGTGMFDAGTDIIGFSTGGTEKLRINATGNVGIGTTSPGAQLAVHNGGICCPATSTFYGLNVPYISSTSTLFSLVNTGNAFVIATTTSGFNGAQQPILYAVTTTTEWGSVGGSRSFNGDPPIRVAIGTTTQGAELGLRDQFVLNGRFNPTYSHFFCDDPGVGVLQSGVSLTFASSFGCGMWNYKQQSDTFFHLASTSPGFGRFVIGETDGFGANDGFVVTMANILSNSASSRASGFIVGSSTPVFEVWVRFPNLTGNILTDMNIFIGFQRLSNALDVQNEQTNDGCYFAFRSSGNWDTVSRLRGKVNNLGTDVAPAVNTKFQRMRVEVASSTCRFFINDQAVGTHTTTTPAAAMTPMAWFGGDASVASAVNRFVDVTRLRLWYNPAALLEHNADF